MKSTGQLPSLAFLLMSAALNGAADADVTIAASGRAGAVIIVSDSTSEWDRVASNDLKAYLDQVTGSALEVVPEKGDAPVDAGARSRIIVGDGTLARRLAPQVQWDGLGSDEILMKTVGRDLILAGGKPRGTVYAVYTFLQDIVGCRNVKFFHEVGVDGVLVQGGSGKAADLVALRTWVTAQLMWNPDQDPRALMIEFLTGYYGAAAPFLMEYIDAMVDAAHRRRDMWLGSYEFTTAAWATVRDMNAATRLFDEAAAAVANDEILSQRVWVARQSIDLSWLDRYEPFKSEARATGVPFLGPADPSRVVDAVAPYRTAWGHWHIGKPFSAYFDEIRAKFPSPGEDPK